MNECRKDLSSVPQPLGKRRINNDSSCALSKQPLSVAQPGHTCNSKHTHNLPVGKRVPFLCEIFGHCDIKCSFSLIRSSTVSLVRQLEVTVVRLEPKFDSHTRIYQIKVLPVPICFIDFFFFFWKIAHQNLVCVFAHGQGPSWTQLSLAKIRRMRPR